MSKVLTSTRWRCSKCGRRFTKRNQWHSCVSYSVDDHFQGKPAALRETFDFLTARVRKVGPFRIDAVKSSINIVGKYHFAAVHVLRSSLTLGFLLNRRLNDTRIVRVEEVGTKKYLHIVRLAHRKDVDARIAKWMKEAYALRG